MTLYDDGSPERLWHYTSGSGAKGIFESRTLWAGHLRYMSDTSEVGHAMSVSREVVERLKRELSEHQGALQRWTEYVTDSPPKSWAPNVFAVSFSEERDLLSQWRGYATGRRRPVLHRVPLRHAEGTDRRWRGVGVDLAKVHLFPRRASRADRSPDQARA